MIRRLAALATLALVLTAVPALTYAQDGRTFESGGIHFVVPDGLLVSATTVRAPEGPVDVVFVRPSDSDAASFVALTVFSTPLPGDGDQVDIARDAIVDGIGAALRGARIDVSDRAITLSGQPVDAVRLAIDANTARATATAGAVSDGTLLVVYYDQRSAADGDWFDALNTVGETFGFGAAPARDAAAPNAAAPVDPAANVAADQEAEAEADEDEGVTH